MSGGKSKLFIPKLKTNNDPGTILEKNLAERCTEFS